MEEFIERENNKRRSNKKRLNKKFFFLKKKEGKDFLRKQKIEQNNIFNENREKQKKGKAKNT